MCTGEEVSGTQWALKEDWSFLFLIFTALGKGEAGGWAAPHRHANSGAAASCGPCQSQFRKRWTWGSLHLFEGGRVPKATAGAHVRSLRAGLCSESPLSPLRVPGTSDTQAVFWPPSCHPPVPNPHTEVQVSPSSLSPPLGQRVRAKTEEEEEEKDGPKMRSFYKCVSFPSEPLMKTCHSGFICVITG